MRFILFILLFYSCSSSSGLEYKVVNNRKTDVNQTIEVEIPQKVESKELVELRTAIQEKYQAKEN